MSETELRIAVADVCRRLHDKGFVASNDGNVTARLEGGRLLVTPSGVSKGDVTPESLLVCDMEGKKLAGEGKVTTEILLHLAVYRDRADVGAAVHAHPIWTTACTVAGVKLDEPVLPEVAVTLGRIPTTRYATPTSQEGPDAIRELIGRHDAIVLDRHGALTVGRTPLEAYFRMEKLEHAAKIVALAQMLGRVQTLTPDEIERLCIAVKRHGVTAKIAR
jgi:L-fuculose-phosphate aldolase